MPCFWHVWCRVCGMFCGLNREDIVAGGQVMFRDGFGSKFSVYRSCQEVGAHYPSKLLLPISLAILQKSFMLIYSLKIPPIATLNAFIHF